MVLLLCASLAKPCSNCLHRLEAMHLLPLHLQHTTNACCIQATHHIVAAAECLAPQGQSLLAQKLPQQHIPGPATRLAQQLQAGIDQVLDQWCTELLAAQ
jgi:hypothetical protein